MEKMFELILWQQMSENIASNLNEVTSLKGRHGQREALVVSNQVLIVHLWPERFLPSLKDTNSRSHQFPIRQNESRRIGDWWY